MNCVFSSVPGKLFQIGIDTVIKTDLNPKALSHIDYECALIRVELDPMCF